MLVEVLYLLSKFGTVLGLVGWRPAAVGRRGRDLRRLRGRRTACDAHRAALEVLRVQEIDPRAVVPGSVEVRVPIGQPRQRGAARRDRSDQSDTQDSGSQGFHVAGSG